jgi:hypothetical protein
MIVPWPCLRGCINAACEIVTVAQVRSDLIIIDFVTGGVDIEVGLQGAAVGSGIQMCVTLTEARKVRMKFWPRRS